MKLRFETLIGILTRNERRHRSSARGTSWNIGSFWNHANSLRHSFHKADFIFSGFLWQCDFLLIHHFPSVGKHPVAKSTRSVRSWWKMFTSWKNWSHRNFSGANLHLEVTFLRVLGANFTTVSQDYLHDLEKEEEEQRKIHKVLLSVSLCEDKVFWFVLYDILIPILMKIGRTEKGRA